MTSRKAKRRIAETYSALEESLATKAADDALANRNDDELFVVDRKGSKTARRKVVKEQERKERGTLHSATEEHLVRKKMKEMQEREQKKEEDAKKGSTESMDIWGEAADDGGIPAVPQRRRMASHSANKSTLKVVGPGFSYNPAQTHHQDVLAEASALEMAKRERDARDKASMDRGHAIIITNGSVDDGDQESSDDDRDSDDVDNDTSAKMVATTKKKDKLTKAQRNKLKRTRALSTEQKQAKVVKDLDKQINDLPKILKAMEKDKKTKEAQKALKAVLRSDNKDEGALTYGESGAVPLSDELGGSLRTLIPKGSSVRAMANTYDDAGKTIKPVKSRGGAARYARPHKAPNVKWIARHKYT